MTDQPETRRSPAVPKPPSREDIDRISEAQGMITDDWTGDGGKPEPHGQASVKPDSAKT